MRLALVGHLELEKLKITSRKSLKASQLRLTFSCQKLLIWAKSRCSSIWKKYPSFRKNLPSKGKNIWLFSLLRKKSKICSLESKEKFFDFFRANLSDLEWFECQFQKLTYGAFFPLNFHHWVGICGQLWLLVKTIEFWNTLCSNLINNKVNFKIPCLLKFFNSD